MRNTEYPHITVNRAAGIFCIKNVSNKRFIDILKTYCGKWLDERKYWILPIENLDCMKIIAKVFFGTVYYSEGGDYKKL